MVSPKRVNSFLAVRVQRLDEAPFNTQVMVRTLEERHFELMTTDAREDLSCEIAMAELFSEALTRAISMGWPESKAAYYLAEAADQSVMDIWKVRWRAKFQ